MAYTKKDARGELEVLGYLIFYILMGIAYWKLTYHFLYFWYKEAGEVGVAHFFLMVGAVIITTGIYHFIKWFIKAIKTAFFGEENK